MGWLPHLGLPLADLAVASHGASAWEQAAGAVVVLAAGAVAWGVLTQRPLVTQPWWLLAGALALLGPSIAVHGGEHVLADSLLVGSALVLASAIDLFRRHGAPRSDRTTVVEAAVLTAGTAIGLWSFLIQPFEGEVANEAQQLSTLAHFVAVLAPIAVLARFLLTPGTRAPSRVALSLGTVALVAGAGVLYSAHVDGGLAGAVASGLFGLGAALVGLAALHPSMRLLTQAARTSESPARRGRLAALAVASSIPPAALAAELVTDDDPSWLVPLTGSVAIFGLVFLRMAGMLNSEEAMARRETALREAATALGAAPAGAIAGVASKAAGQLVEGVPGAFVRLVGGEGSSHALLRYGGVDVHPIPTWVRTTLQVPGSADSLVVLPFAPGKARHGGLAIGSSGPLSPHVRGALDMLSRQVGLAIDAADQTLQRERQRNEDRFKSLVQNASDVIAVAERDLRLRAFYGRAATSGVLGYRTDELMTMSVADVVHPDDVAEFVAGYRKLAGAPGATAAFELRMVRRDGQHLRTEVVATNLLEDAGVRGVVLTIRDVTDRRRLEERLEHQAYHDPLTGLANRSLFGDRVEHAIRSGAVVAVLFVDLDDFKHVNDSLGHKEGDRLLVAVSRRIEAAVRPSDVVARLGGDEFAVLMERIGGVEDAEAVARRIVEELSRPFDLDGRQAFVGASVGVAVSNETTGSATELLRDADVAMYSAKTEGKGAHRVFEADMHVAAVRRFELSTELRRALEADELVIHYQPIVELDTGAVAGMEALVRWDHPRRGLVSPGEFLPLAEEVGLMRGLDSFVLRRACEEATHLTRIGGGAGGRPLMVTVNLSVRTFRDPELVAEVAAVLGATGLEPGALVIELTEHAIMEDHEEAVAAIEAMRELGVRFAIDDFGTGYSSLAYLRDLPVDILKIAQSFVDGLSRDASDVKLAGVIVDLADTFGLRTIAEGVETAGQRELLRTLGYHMAQGYHFGRPLTASLIADVLRMGAIGPTSLENIAAR